MYRKCIIVYNYNIGLFVIFSVPSILTMENEFYTASELAEKLNCNIRVLHRKLRAGEIKGYKKMRRWVIFKNDLAKWLRA